MSSRVYMHFVWILYVTNVIRMCYGALKKSLNERQSSQIEIFNLRGIKPGMHVTTYERCIKQKYQIHCNVVVAKTGISVALNFEQNESYYICVHDG